MISTTFIYKLNHLHLIQLTPLLCSCSCRYTHTQRKWLPSHTFCLMHLLKTFYLIVDVQKIFFVVDTELVLMKNLDVMVSNIASMVPMNSLKYAKTNQQKLLYQHSAWFLTCKIFLIPNIIINHFGYYFDILHALKILFYLADLRNFKTRDLKKLFAAC